MLSLFALDLHPGNIVLVDESVSKMSAEDVLRSMDSPETAEVRGYAIGKHTPQYLVLPSTLPLSAGLSSNCNVKQLQCQAIAMSRLLTSVLLSFLARRHQECDVRYRSELQKL